VTLGTLGYLDAEIKVTYNNEVVDWANIDPMGGLRLA
jgi:hypothetical protein